MPRVVARLAQSVERKALNLVVVGSSPTVGDLYAPTISDRKMGTHIGPALKSTTTLAIAIASLTTKYQGHMV